MKTTTSDWLTIKNLSLPEQIAKNTERESLATEKLAATIFITAVPVLFAFTWGWSLRHHKGARG